MTTLFFYGTLRHVPLLEIVLGRAEATLAPEVAVLPDHAALSVREGLFPALVPRAGAQAQGIVVSGLGAAEMARLDYYEGSFDYDLTEVALADGRLAQVYMARPGRWQTGAPWDLATWEARWAPLSCHAAREVMDYFGRRSREEVDAMFPMIRARAQARVNAARSIPGDLVLHGKVQVEDQSRVYSKFFALDEVRLRHERFDGSMSGTLDRAVFVPVDAAFVLPYDPVRDRVLLIEQFRMGPLIRGDRACWQLELIAGRVDAGECPAEAALREAREEAGLEVGEVQQIAQIYPSSGCSTEFFHVFLGICDLPDAAEGTGGLAEEGEDIRSHLVAFETLLEMCDAQRIPNAALTLAAYWLARHRERLRLAQGGATS